jgi:hypothetical protein
MGISDQQDLYVIGEGDGSGVVKIGKSVDPQKRLSGLQTGNPRRLRVLHVEPEAGHLEEQLHERFAEIRIGGEWFDFGHDDPLVLVQKAVKDLTLLIYTEADLDRALVEAKRLASKELEGALRERDRQWVQFQELADYTRRAVNAHAAEIAPEVFENGYITGSTEKEIDASIARAIELTIKGARA